MFKSGFCVRRVKLQGLKVTVPRSAKKNLVTLCVALISFRCGSELIAHEQNNVICNYVLILP